MKGIKKKWGKMEEKEKEKREVGRKNKLMSTTRKREMRPYCT